MSRVAVKPEMLKWARERARLQVHELTPKFKKYEQWEAGDVQPTFKQLTDFARATSTPLGYLFLEDPPEEHLYIPDFRTVRDTSVGRPSADLLETIQIMERRQAWLRDYREEEGYDPLPFVGSVTKPEPPELVAHRMRHDVGLDSGWASDVRTWTEARGMLRASMEEMGILVVINGIVENNTHRRLDPSEFRGFVLCDDVAPAVFVNGADAKAAQTFTLAHELAHLYLGKSALFDLPHLLPGPGDTEAFCNKVAAEFLVPGEELLAAWTGALASREPFAALARRFKVSPIVVARRCLDLKMINRQEFVEFYDDHLAQAAARERATDVSGGDFWANQAYRVGDRFARAVISATREGRLLYRDAYSLLGLKGRTFDTYAQRLGL